MIAFIHLVSAVCGVTILIMFLFILGFIIIGGLTSFVVELVPIFKEAFDKLEHELDK